MVGVTRLPFDHVVGGAPSGNWYQGDLGFDGTPLAFARDGAPPGYMTIDFDGATHRVTFHAANQPLDRQMALSFNTPSFRDWMQTAQAWQIEQGMGADAVPPLSVGDLEDVSLFTPQEIERGVWLTANVWNGDRDTKVTARIGDGPETPLERTQEGEGEAVREGAEFADPFAVSRQMTIGRYALGERLGRSAHAGLRGLRRRALRPRSAAGDQRAQRQRQLAPPVAAADARGPARRGPCRRGARDRPARPDLGRPHRLRGARRAAAALLARGALGPSGELTRRTDGRAQGSR